MLNAVPYTSITDSTLNGALHYLQLAFTPDALTLYAVRQPILLAALRNPRPSTSATATEMPIPIHTLYADGLAFAALQQFSGDPQAAAKTVAELDAALPTPLEPDDSIPIGETRRQYALLGTHLPAIAFSVPLLRRRDPAHQHQLRLLHRSLPLPRMVCAVHPPDQANPSCALPH